MNENIRLNIHKTGDLVRLNQHSEKHDTLYQIIRTQETEQFAYTLVQFHTRKRLAGTWQHYQLVPVSKEAEPEYYL